MVVCCREGVRKSWYTYCSCLVVKGIGTALTLEVGGKSKSTLVCELGATKRKGYGCHVTLADGVW
jgi:hypothetical protein